MPSPRSTAPSDTQLIVVTKRGRTRVALADYLSPADAEAAEAGGNQWIKQLRGLAIDSENFRDRFTFRGDSLWWFTELYLHKQRTAAQILATAAATRALLADARPDALELETGGAIARRVVQSLARQAGSAWLEPRSALTDWAARAGTALATRVLGTSAAWRRVPRRPIAASSRPAVAVFLHTAFWQEARGTDTYVGPVLDALARVAPDQRVRRIGLGPSDSFRVRTVGRRVGGWVRGAPDSTLEPIEAFATPEALADAAALWRLRSNHRRLLFSAPALRESARTDGVDWWPLLCDDLAGVAERQWPWSARAMAEAGAALDALRPAVVVTYAEAGGWGRALTLEARRRSIPVVGLQHGFISRHWLNYRHEADELQPSAAHPEDRGCPLPDLTLLYDAFARAHLLAEGRYPEERLRVTGNPRVEAMLAESAALTPEHIASARTRAGARPDQHLVVLAAKRIPEFDATFSALIRAAAAMPDVHLAIRPHPAETAEPYAALAAGASNVRIVERDVPAVALIRAARVVATINSTVAIEALLLGTPALAMRLPNYLSPFVDAGAMAGTATPDEIGGVLTAMVRDERLRAQLASRSAAFVDRYDMRSDGHAADRAAEAILSFVR